MASSANQASLLSEYMSPVLPALERQLAPAACDHRPAEGWPGQVPACRDLDVMPALEESQFEEDLGR